MAAALWLGKTDAGAAGAGPKDRAGEVGLGPGASLGGRRPFPDDDPWNQDISRLPVDPNSDALIRSIGLDKPLHPDFGTTYRGAPNGIPYVVVPGTQPLVPVRFRYRDESDPGPYPVPPDAAIEGGPNGQGDRHVLVIDRDGWKLYELFSATRQGDGWVAGSGAIFDLACQPAAAGGLDFGRRRRAPHLPGPGSFRRVSSNARSGTRFRFTCARTRRAYVFPARHFASPSSDPNLPPMGMRVRLKAELRRLPLLPRGPRDPDRSEDLRHAPGRQRQRLVPQRRA